MCAQILFRGTLTTEEADAAVGANRPDAHEPLREPLKGAGLRVWRHHHGQAEVENCVGSDRGCLRRVRPWVSAPAGAREQQPALDHACTSELVRPGVMSDVISNAMTLGLKTPERNVRVFLEGAHERYATGAEVLSATARHFEMDEAVLAAEVEKFRHCNCRLGPMPDGTPPPALANHRCSVDLALTGDMKVALSNALLWGLHQPDPRVTGFLAGAQERYSGGPQLLTAAAKHFKVDETVLATEVERYRHCNCTMAQMFGGELEGADGGPALEADGRQVDAPIEVSAFARDVTLHVVLHELGHALIREFDIPVLGNEEAAADAFATYYLTTYLPDRAVDVLTARVTSLMIEAGETPEVDWTGEHDDDARRAYQIAALAVAADALKYKPVAAVVGMSEGDIRDARDYGAENRRSWRRVLGPLWMPEGTASSEARVLYDADIGFISRLCADGLAGRPGRARQHRAEIPQGTGHRRGKGPRRPVRVLHVGRQGQERRLVAGDVRRRCLAIRRDRYDPLPRQAWRYTDYRVLYLQRSPGRPVARHTRARRLQVERQGVREGEVLTSIVPRTGCSGLAVPAGTSSRG